MRRNNEGICWFKTRNVLYLKDDDEGNKSATGTKSV